MGPLWVLSSGLVTVVATGKGATCATYAANLPLSGRFVLDPPTVDAGQCAAMDFSGPVGVEPACALKPLGTTLVCK